MKPSNTLSFKLHAVVCLLDEVANKLLQEGSNISLPQFLIVLCVYENPGSSQKFIAKWLQLTEATISHNLKLVLKKDLIKIKTDEKDSRFNKVYVTKKGSKTIEFLYPIYEDSLSKNFSSINKNEHEILSNSLDKLIESLAERNNQ